MKHSAKAALVAVAALGVTTLGPLGPLGAGPASADPEVAPTGPVVTETRWTSESGGNLGYASSRTSCDVNGDEYADTVSGDWFWDKSPNSNVGAAYVLLGTADPAGGPAGSGADAGIVRIDGPTGANNTFAGMSVSCLGDINGDGLDDIAIGSNRVQKVWVVLGAEDFTSVDLGSLGTRGFLVTSSVAAAQNTANPVVSRNFGYWVSGLGDVNHDGFNDFAVTDNLYDGPSADNIGRVYVISGSDSVADVDIDTPAGGTRVVATIDGFDTGGQILSAEDAGDVNGDGIDDFAAGSYTATPWGPSPTAVGAAFVVFGSAQPLTVRASALGEHGFTIRGPIRGGDRLGVSIAKLGDVNGDGKDDLLLGADNGSGAAVVLGSASTATVYTRPGAADAAVYACAGSTSPAGDGACADAAAPVERGYWVNGPAGTNFGWATAGVPDINGDAVPELLVGAYNADFNALTNSGSAYVVYGKAQGHGTYDATTITPQGTADGFRVDGYAANAKLGRSVGSAGDFDGNGRPDLLVGAQGATSNPLSYASVFLLGGAELATSTPTIDDPTPTYGQTLSVAAGTWTDGAALGYQWKQDGTVIAGATGTTLTLTDPDLVGARISVEVTGTKTWYDDAVVESAATAAVAGATLATSLPVVDDTTPSFGQTLTADPGTWTAGADLSFQWLVDGAAVTGRTTSTFTVDDAAWIGHRVSVRVSGSLPGYDDAAETSEPTTAVAAASLTGPAPTVGGSKKVGTTVSAVPGAWPAGTSLTYAWYDGATRLSTEPSYRLPAATYRRTLTLKVTGTKVGHAPVTTTTTFTVAAGTLTSPAPAITGTARVGRKLTATTKGWTPGTRFTYQWFADGVKIKGATGRKLTLTSAQARKRVVVKVTGRLTGYVTVTAKASARTKRVAR